MQKKSLISLIMAVLLIVTGASSYYAIRQGQHSKQPSAIPQDGVIAGSVLNAEEQPVAHAKVRAVSSRGSRGRQPEARTDQQGKFTLTHLRPDTYMVVVEKDEDGYLPTDSTFHFDGVTTAPNITIGEDQTVSDVVLHIGQKGGKLTGRITDAVTNRPIRSAHIILRRVDNPRSLYITTPDFLEGKGRFVIVVPTVPFTLEVKAPGYEDWTYSSDPVNKHADALKLEKEETKSLDIALRPVK